MEVQQEREAREAKEKANIAERNAQELKRLESQLRAEEGRQRKQQLEYESARALQIQEETLKKQRAIEIKQAEDKSKRLQDEADC